MPLPVSIFEQRIRFLAPVPAKAEERAMYGNAFANFVFLPGHAPKAISPDCFTSRPSVLFTSSLSVGVKRASGESAISDFTLHPAGAIEALLANRPATVEIHALHSVSGLNDSLHGALSSVTSKRRLALSCNSTAQRSASSGEGV